MPSKEMKVSTTDVPWMNSKLRQQAFVTHGIKSTIFEQYRNLVNREQKSYRAKYYKLNIHKLKEKTSKKWWSEVKRVSNFNTKREPISLTNVQAISNLTQKERANKSKTLFRTTGGIQAKISITKFCFGRNVNLSKCIRNKGAKSFIKTSNKYRANGPDKLPKNWVLKEYRMSWPFQSQLFSTLRIESNVYLPPGKWLTSHLCQRQKL